MSLREGRFERACELFYEAAGSPDLWPEALDAVANACGAAGAVLLPIGIGPGNVIPSPGIEEYVADLVTEGWEASNSRMQRGLQLTAAGKRGLITDTDMFTRDEHPRDPFYNDFVVPHGMGATAGMVLARFESDFVLPISFERRAEDGPFLPSEVAVMNRYMSVLQSGGSLFLAAGLQTARSLADSLSMIGKDIALLSGSGRVVHMSPSFERHIGDAVTMRHGILGSWNATVDQQLTAAINKVVRGTVAADRAVPEIFLPRRGDRRPLRAQLVPLVGRAQDIFMIARGVLIVTEPQSSLVKPVETDALIKAFGLSRAEARLASRIAAGETVKTAALAEGISNETARSRLKLVFAKTGTHRQAELALLIAGLKS
jgi:DNA-binding CsgD family transcriptional regulator